MKPGTVFVLSVALAALVASMVYRQLHVRDVALEEAQRAHAVKDPTVQVVVARATLPIGTRITQDQLTTIPWVAGSEPEGAVSDPRALVGKLAVSKIEKNHPVAQTDVAAEGAGLLPLMIPEGMRAISVKIDTVTGVSGFVTPGSHVDVLVASGSRTGEVRSKLFLQNVKVLAMGKSTVQGDESAASAPTATLLVTPEQAEEMMLASRFEPVQLALRSLQDEETVTTQGASSNALFAGSSPDAPATEEEAAPPEHRGYSVEVLLQGKSTRQAVF